ncbi:MAG: triphosphoribosyl-dephospho-CoA synthase [Methanosarcinaceae archaeon]|nr:triphosphoribosyl-dephospho-CoA synthase [Methanosarcinaceae archaeon]
MNLEVNPLLLTEYNGISGKIAPYIARCVQLAMALEVSATPKPGNIDRDHNYVDTQYEHFLASAVSIYPVMENAAKSEKGIGELIKHAVCESVKWQRGGNTHFGAFILLVPLVMAAGNILAQGKRIFTLEELTSCAHDIVKNSDSTDAIEFYKSFRFAEVRVNSVDEFDMQDVSSIDSLQDQNVTLYDLMEISKGYDLIANEWTSGFKRCAQCGERLLRSMSNTAKDDDSWSNINDIIVYTFLKTLSENRDTFIQTKFNSQTADYVSERARGILAVFVESSGFYAKHPSIQQFDEELLQKGINPGSTADIVIAGLFIALLGGMGF